MNQAFANVLKWNEIKESQSLSLTGTNDTLILDDEEIENIKDFLVEEDAPVSPNH
jgi:hypothetical protein